MVNLQLWSQVALQCTTSGQSNSPLPRQQKWLQRLWPTFCFIHSHTCKFGGKSHGTCGGSFHTEIPAIHNFLDLNTFSEASCRIFPIAACWRTLISRHWPRPTEQKMGRREAWTEKLGICAVTKLYWLVLMQRAKHESTNWTSQNHKDILKHCKELIPLWSSKEGEWK